MQLLFYRVWLLCSVLLMVIAITIGLTEPNAPGTAQVASTIGGIGLLLFIVSLIGLYHEGEI